MSRTELIVSIICLVAGYWLVSRFSSGRRPPQDPRDSRSERDPGRADPGPPPRAPSAGEPVVPLAGERATLSNWYRILGVAEDAGADQIAAAYKRAIAKYHPDKVAQMGEEIRAVAEAKSVQINAAYEIGMRLFRL